MAPVPSLPIFAAEPDPTQDVVVRRRYDTNILVGESGYEQRVSLADVPLTVLAFSVQQIEAHRWGETLGMGTPTPTGRLLVPFWPDAVELYGPVEAGQTLVPALTATRGFAAGGWALLWSPTERGGIRYAAAEIAAVAEDAITLVAPLAQAWGAVTACVIPLVVGVLSEQVEGEKLGLQSGSLAVEFIVEPPVEGRGIAPAAAPRPVVASIVVEPMMSGQNHTFWGTPFAMLHTLTPRHWYFRATALDALGVPIQRVELEWTSNHPGGGIVPSGNPMIIRHEHPTHPTEPLVVTATAGGVSGSVLVNLS